MKHTFVLYSVQMKIHIEGVNKVGGKVRVAFDAMDLGLPDTEANEITRWIVSNKFLMDTKNHATLQFIRGGASGWMMEPGQRYDAFAAEIGVAPYIEVCDKWLKKLFGEIPEALYFRQVRMVG